MKQRVIKHGLPKVGDELWVVPTSIPIEDKSIFSKPLGIFKTKIINIMERVDYGFPKMEEYMLAIDNKCLSHLYLPENMTVKSVRNSGTADEYAATTNFFILRFDNKKQNIYLWNENIFFTEKEAKEFYDKKMVKFNETIEKYIIRIESTSNSYQKKSEELAEIARKYREKYGWH